MELDSRADTCAFGKDCLIVHDTGARVSVEPFIQSIGSVPKVPIVTVAVAYDDPTTSHAHVMFFHQVLHMPNMDTHLVSPFQLRDHGVLVNDVPLLHVDPDNRNDSHHTIYIPTADVTLPLSLRGTMSGLTVRKPTWTEVNDVQQHDVTHLQMTLDAIWDPNDPDCHHQETALCAAVLDPCTIPSCHVHSTQVGDNVQEPDPLLLLM